jgi:hypothetical protein
MLTIEAENRAGQAPEAAHPKVGVKAIRTRACRLRGGCQIL